MTTNADGKVATAKDWLSQDAFRLKRSLRREEVEIVISSLGLSISEQVDLYALLEEEGVYEDSTSEQDDKQDSDEESYLLARSLSIETKCSANQIIGKMLSHRVLNKEEEQVLARKIHLAKDIPSEATDEKALRIAQEAQEAVQALMLFNLRLVWTCAEFYGNASEMEIEDLMQEGIFGLLRAIQKFDYTRDLKFSTYAVWWIRQAITRSIQNSGALIRIPSYLHVEIRQFKQAKKLIEAESYQRGNKFPSISKIADELNWDLEKALFISQLLLFENVYSVDSIGKESNFSFQIPCSNGNYAKNLEDKDFNEFVHGVISSLSEREFDILKRRFGLNELEDEETLEQIGQDYNLTRERIRQIEAGALKRLRPKFIAHGIDEENLDEWLH